MERLHGELLSSGGGREASADEKPIHATLVAGVTVLFIRLDHVTQNLWRDHTSAPPPCDTHSGSFCTSLLLSLAELFIKKKDSMRGLQFQTDVAMRLKLQQCEIKSH